MIFKEILRKSGKTYLIDPQIPNGLFVNVLLNRLYMLLRGFFLMRQKIFIGKNCKILNKSNFKIGKGVTIGHNTILDGYASTKIIFGDYAKIGAYSCLTTTSHLSKYGVGLVMGSNSAIGDYTHFGASGGIKIGNDVIMGSYISFHSENHSFSDKSILIREQGVTSVGIILGNNIWVGAKVTFLDGCIVGNNCVVAAGAVVNGQYPDNCIIGGIPAKIIKTI